jgi:hypothetical protein
MSIFINHSLYVSYSSFLNMRSECYTLSLWILKEMIDFYKRGGSAMAHTSPPLPPSIGRLLRVQRIPWSRPHWIRAHLMSLLDCFWWLLSILIIRILVILELGKYTWVHWVLYENRKKKKELYFPDRCMHTRERVGFCKEKLRFYLGDKSKCCDRGHL